MALRPGSLRTGDLGHFFYGEVQGLGKTGVCGLVQHFLTLPVGYDEPCALMEP